MMELIDHNKANSQDMVTQKCNRPEAIDLLCVVCGWEGHAQAPDTPWAVFVGHLREQRAFWIAKNGSNSDTRIEAYLTATSLGGFFDYKLMIAKGQRQGQAFFNALNDRDQYRLRGTINDPFYNTKLIGWAIDFLLDN